MELASPWLLHRIFRERSGGQGAVLGAMQAVQDTLLHTGGQRHILNVGHGVVQVPFWFRCMASALNYPFIISLFSNPDIDIGIE